VPAGAVGLAMADPSRLTDLRGQVAVVTGGANGIGAAVVELLTAAGARVVALDREVPPVLPERAEAIAVDVTSEAEIDAAMAQVADRHGRLDVLVASAGIAIRRPATELALDDWQKVVDVNLTGVFLCARSAARHMIAGGGGSIVAIASVLGVVGGGVYPNVSYQAAKGGVINLTRALALEWSAYGIRVNAIAPTYVHTRLTAGLVADADVLRQIEERTPLGRLAEPEEVADAVLFLAGRGSAMVTGHVLAVDGGYLAQ
jgi:NAD(P)-dependent dehydrogenase (short-subunit alcohol dehydrogenase family)